MKVLLLEHTPNPDQLVATAAKLCYSNSDIEELFEKQTSQNVEGFIKKLMDMGHESPIEHVNFTFAIEGVSRALTHQLVRHRIASYSQQSQRYVKLDAFEYITPPSIAADEGCNHIYDEYMADAQAMYDDLVFNLIARKAQKFLGNKDFYLSDFIKSNPKEYAKFEKEAIEDARYVFPNACATKIIVTMNARSLMNFFEHRCCTRAQWEIRALAYEMLRLVREVAPILFKNAGAACEKTGICPEGSMSCGRFPIK